MRNLERRLNRLEALRTDSSGLVPYSPRWFAYWDEQICISITGGEATGGNLPPSALVEVLRHIVQSPASFVNMIPDSNGGASSRHSPDDHEERA